MNNIEEIKKELDSKLAKAIRENEENEKNGDLGFTLGDASYTDPSKTMVYFRGGHYGARSVREAQEILNAYPQTDDISVNVGRGEKRMLPYHIYVKSDMGHCEEIYVDYISGDYEIYFQIRMDKEDTDLMQFFSPVRRPLSQYEMERLGAKTRWNKRLREDGLRYYSWSCGMVTKFQGGSDLQHAPGILTSFIETIKWKSLDE